MLNTNTMMKEMCTQQDNIVRMSCYDLNPNDIPQEQCTLITPELTAEYNAIGKMNNIIAETVYEIKKEKDPFKIKLLESRINTLNSMIAQRETHINQMEQALSNSQKRPHLNS